MLQFVCPGAAKPIIVKRFMANVTKQKAAQICKHYYHHEYYQRYYFHRDDYLPLDYSTVENSSFCKFSRSKLPICEFELPRGRNDAIIMFTERLDDDETFDNMFMFDVERYLALSDLLCGASYVSRTINHAIDSWIEDHASIVVAVVVNHPRENDEMTKIVVDFQKSEIKSLKEIRDARGHVKTTAAEEVPGINIEISNQEKKLPRGLRRWPRTSPKPQRPSKGYC